MGDVVAKNAACFRDAGGGKVVDSQDGQLNRREKRKE